MTLNLNISIGGNSATQSLEPVQDVKSSKSAVSHGSAFNGLSITNKAVSSEDIKAATINESELTRDDALGNLVKTAFNLPPPPPPWE